MKSRIQNGLIVLAMFAGIHMARAAVSFVVTPEVVSNTYNGTITLQISGLTNTETVVIQKFLDVNTNGLVDAGDYLVQQLDLTDGQVGMVIGGVTNFNVPGDTDGTANGQITATPNFQDGDFVQNIVGQYLFVLSSPRGHFGSITNLFTVTNFPCGQKITGNVVNDGTNVPNAVVFLSTPQPAGSQGPGNPVAGCVANESGAYSVQVPPGSYVPFAVSSDFVVNFSACPVVTLGSGGTVNTNLTLTNVTQSISGQVVDANNASIGLPGVFTPATASVNGQTMIAICFSDTNGNFIEQVGPGQWGLGSDDSGLIVHGYVGWNNSTNVSAGATGILLAFPRATALFYGSVTDNFGNPLAGVDIGASDNNDDLYEADAYSEANGEYVLGVLGGLGAGDPWQVEYDGDNDDLTDYIFSQPSFNQNGGTNINTGRAVKVNFTGVLGANTISGNVQDSFGNPIAGLGVNASATINGTAYSIHVDTDNNGKYSMNAGNADWDLSINCGDGGDGLQDIYTNSSFQCPNDQYININNTNETANFAVQITSGAIFGVVVDDNGNPVAGVEVYANDGMGDNYSTTTDGRGFYSMETGDGNWDVNVDCGELNALGYNCVNDDYVTVSENQMEGDFTAQFSSPSPAFQFVPLYSFSATELNANSIYTNSDGAAPFGGLVLSGNTLYGAATESGTNGSGTIFGINTNLTNFRTVYTFTAAPTNDLGLNTNSDGDNPNGMILSSNTLYGTTYLGGTNGVGTVFAVTTNGSYRVLYTFTAEPANSFGINTNFDGANPNAALLLSSNALYGATTAGGLNGNGTVFAIATNGGFRLVHTFSATDPNYQTNGDGASPYAALIQSGGILYGTATGGGTNGYGTIFKVNTNGTGFVTLYNFSGGNDGANPIGALVLASNILYGTAAYRGYWGGGTVFAISTNGTGFAVLHSFSDGDDGATPYGGLILSSNALYGTAFAGGIDNFGAVFAVNVLTGHLTVLHGFTDGDDGAYPYDNLILSGNVLYGTTSSGGVSGNGEVFGVSIAAQSQAASLSSPGFLSRGQFQMTVNGAASQNYMVQMSTNLLSTNWTSLLLTNPSGGSFLFTDMNATNGARFYRVLTGQ